MMELLERLNVDVGQPIVVDILFETEDIDEVTRVISVDPQDIPPRKLVLRFLEIATERISTMSPPRSGCIRTGKWGSTTQMK